jgi:flagellar motor switch protein FliN/FliY
MDGMLSQEEINALLNGIGGEEDTSDSSANENTLTDSEKDAVGEISNISMGTAATTLSTLVNQKVTITTPVVSYGNWQELAASFNRPCVFIQISYREGLDGNNVLILKESDVKVITDLMMGGDGTNNSDELSELHLSAISEAMNQMMGSASTSISSMLMKKVDISPPTAQVIDLNDSVDLDTLSDFLKGSFVQVSFKMEIGDLVDSEIMQIYPFDFAKDIYQQFVGGNDIEEPVNANPGNTAPINQNAVNEPMMNQTINTMQAQPQMQQPMMQQPQMGMMNQQMQAYPNMMQGQVPNMPQMGMPYGMAMPDVNVQPAQFQAFSGGMNPITQQENIDLIMDVPLEVTVELGRKKKSIK